MEANFLPELLQDMPVFDCIGEKCRSMSLFFADSSITVQSPRRIAIKTLRGLDPNFQLG
jgi:hypothetical protein